MSLELSGTTGVKGVAGSVSAPSIVGDDTNTGISFPSADTIKFSTGGVERMSITNSGVTGAGGGKILQVLQTTKTDTFSTASSSYVDVTGISQAITPSATSSKILISISLGFVSGSHTGNQAVYPQFKIVRDSTDVLVGDASGNRGICTFSVLTNLHGGYNGTSASFLVLDSPNTTSATTYKLQAKNGYYDSDQSFYVNRMDNDDNQQYTARTPSTIILMEVEG